MTERSASEPTCPQCSAAIQPTWDWCHACGYDLLGLRAATAAPRPSTDPAPATARPSPSPSRPSPTADATPTSASPRSAPPTLPRNVYVPDEGRRLVRPRTAALCAVLVVVAVAMAAAARLATDTGDAAAPDGLPDAPVAFDEGVTDLGDGWTRIAIEDGAVEVELPGPLLRTRADPLVGDLGVLPMAVWGGGTAGVDVYGVAIAELPDDWRTRTPDLLEVVPLPIDAEVMEHQRSAINVGEHPAVRIEANGRDGQVRAVVVATDDRLVTLVYGSASPGAVGDALTRMLRSLELG